MEPNTPIPGETTPPQPLSNDGQPVATPPVNAPDNAEVERLKKEAEQAKMRANQAQNELDRIKQAETAAEAKRLEEKEEFRTLYETTNARLQEMEAAQTAQERQTALTAATTDIFKEYPVNVVELAQTAGLKLSDDTDEARTALKTTLDAFKAKVGGGTPGVTPNNPPAGSPEVVNRAELTARAHPGAESPMALASARGDDSIALKYISDLPAIQRMKEIAQNGA